MIKFLRSRMLQPVYLLKLSLRDQKISKLKFQGSPYRLCLVPRVKVKAVLILTLRIRIMKVLNAIVGLKARQVSIVQTKADLLAMVRSSKRFLNILKKSNLSSRRAHKPKCLIMEIARIHQSNRRAKMDGLMPGMTNLSVSVWTTLNTVRMKNSLTNTD